MKKLKDMFSEKSIVAICLAVGAFLLLTPILFDAEKNDGTAAEYTASDEMAQYSLMLESGLQKAVSQMTGSDNVKVMITLDSTFENIYVSDASINEAVTADKTDIKSEKQLVLTGSSGKEQLPVVVKRIPPKVKGAVIVCEGGNDKNVRSSIAAMAATALNISETKIYVTGGY